MQESRRRKTAQDDSASTSHTAQDTRTEPAERSRNFAARFGIAAVVILLMVGWQLYSKPTTSTSTAWISSKDLQEGHWDFGDGRRTKVASVYLEPKNAMLYYVNVMLGNGGYATKRMSSPQT